MVSRGFSYYPTLSGKTIGQPAGFFRENAPLAAQTATGIMKSACADEEASMTRMEITDMLIEQLISELTPLVEDATGWPLKRDGLHARVLPRERGYEEILLGRLQGAGVDVELAQTRGPLLRLFEYIIECNILAAYEPSRAELMVVRENVDESNMDGLRVVVAHELVHRAQHVNQPDVFAGIDNEVRTIFELISSPDGFKEAMRRVEAMQPAMSLMDSHAMYVQEMLHMTQFPHAAIEHHFTLPALLGRLLGGRKIAQYTDGISEVADAVEQGTVDELFRRMKM
jgi:hypothetical protein